MSEFSNLVGQVLESVTINRDDDEIVFRTKEGNAYKMYHDQDCCESVWIEDIVGGLEDMAGERVIFAYESSSEVEDTEYGDVQQWTFYNIATQRNSATIRWNGSSNGFYSIAVDFCQIEEAQPLPESWEPMVNTGAVDLKVLIPLLEGLNREEIITNLKTLQRKRAQ